MSRHAAVVFACAMLTAANASAQTQDGDLQKQGGEPPERIDILVEHEIDDPEYYAECVDQQEAAAMFGEIVVCRERTGDENRLYNKEEAENRHAERTAFKHDPATPDFIRDCHDQGWPVGCVRMGSVPPPAYIINFEELPDTPPGSDADRAARGLAPRGDSAGLSGSVVIASDGQVQSNAEELGLPPPLGNEVDEEGASPSGSASPEERP